MEPITRKERYLAYLAGDKTVVLPQPVTREERYLAAMCGMDVGLPQAETRVERLMDEIATQSAVSLQPIKYVTITQNGTTNVVPDEGFDGMQSVDVWVSVPDPYESIAFNKNSDGDYIAGYFEGVETSDQVSKLVMTKRYAIWICIEFDVKENGTNILKGATLNWNFEKLKNLNLSGSRMYFSGEIVDEIQLDLIDGKWTLAKSTVDDILVKIKAIFVQLNGSEDAEIVLNDILQCIVLPEEPEPEDDYVL